MHNSIHVKVMYPDRNVNYQCVDWAFQGNNLELHLYDLSAAETDPPLIRRIVNVIGYEEIEIREGKR